MTRPLFRGLLGAAIDDLPPVLRDVHDSRIDQRWSGLAQVANPLARLLCLMMRLPAPGTPFQ